MQRILLKYGSLFFACLFSLIGNARVTSLPGPGTPSESEVRGKLGGSRINWIENRGQQHKDVAYYAGTFAGTVFITHGQQLVYNIQVDQTTSFPLYESFVNAAKISPKGEKISATKVHYLKGNRSAEWRNNVPVFETLLLGELWKGIHVKLNAYGDNIEKLFDLAPGADPHQIRMQLTRARKLSITRQGELLVKTSKGNLRFTHPVAWQIIGGKKQPVEVKYQLYGKTCYGFTAGKYDPHYPLFIDPLIASTFIGGNNLDIIKAVARDEMGNIFVTGQTISTDYPVTRQPYDTSSTISSERDVFISKLSSDLSTLLASVYLGGFRDDRGEDLAIDQGGNVFIMGTTYSPDYPTLGISYDSSANFLTTNSDVFVSKLNNDLSELLGSTFVGGNYQDVGSALAINASGDVYITGITDKTGPFNDQIFLNYPTTENAYDRSYNGIRDIFVSKLNNDLSMLFASTLLGGTAWEDNPDIAVDASGNVFVVGSTKSYDYPFVMTSYDPTYNDDLLPNTYDGDIFVSKLNSDLSSLLGSTFIGGTHQEVSNAIAIDPSGNVFITGATLSPNYPMAGNPFKGSRQAGWEVFVSKLDNSLSSLLASTFIGGIVGNSLGSGIVPDGKGNIYITGNTLDPSYPITGNYYDKSFNGGDDVFISWLNDDLSKLHGSTYIGGNGSDVAYDIIIDTAGDLYVVGGAATGFPVTEGAYDTSHDKNFDPFFISNSDGFVLRFNFNPVYISLTPRTASYCIYDSVLLRAGYNGTDCDYSWSNGDTTKEIYASDTGWYVCHIYKEGITRIDSIRVLRILPVIQYHHDTICAGDSITLTASESATTYLWSLPSGQGGNRDTTREIIVSDPGWYTVMATDTNVCPSYDSFYLVVIQPQALSLPTDTLFCEGDSIELDATHPQYGTYLWSLPPGQGGTGDTIPLLIIREAGLYTVMASDGICTVYDTCNVKVEKASRLALLNDTTLCHGTEIILNALNNQYTVYEWSTGATSPSITVNTSGTYKVSATNGICSISDSTAVNYWSLPSLHLPEDTIVCFDQLEAIILDAGVWKTYQWYPTGERTRQIAASYPELYIVEITDSNNCPGADQVLVEADCPGAVYMPDAFTPNGDGLNDILFIRGNGIREINLKIYNRWGERVFETNDIDKGWDGLFSGEPCIADAYTYTLDFYLKTQTSIARMSGTITLLR